MSERMKGLVQLQKRERRAILEKISKNWPFKMVIEKKGTVKEARIDSRRRILIFDGWMAAQLDETIVPFLGSYELLKSLPAVVVDAGAVSHICNGADVMRPGILKFEGSFASGDIVCVRESRYQKTIAVGIALFSSEEAAAVTKGAIVKNAHYVGDLFWITAKSIRV
ncbi:MAG: PUA domain-containing protein [Thermoproteota archaeon]